MKYPAEYRIEVYLDSFINDPIAGFCSTTPFMAMNVGDEIDPFSWLDGNDESYSNNGEIPKSKMLVIEKVRHLMMIVGEKIIQSTSVKVKAVDRTD